MYFIIVDQNGLPVGFGQKTAGDLDANCYECTQEQYSSWKSWQYVDGAFVAYTAPAPVLTLAQQAEAALAAGVTISTTGSLTLEPTVFPCDPMTTSKISSVVSIFQASGAFPGGGSTYDMKDFSGNWITFTGPQYTAVVLAIASYVAPLDLIVDGHPEITTLPDPVIPTLTV